MDSDRKSTVSSFYGRKSSEPLQQTRPESPSSFYNPDRHSRADFSQPYGSAGYNRHSFFPGRQEPLRGGEDEEMLAAGKDDSWDIYADFNNAGPRYSTAFGQPSDGYHPVPTPTKDENPSSALQTEMVTVPALGPEWKKSEMRDMTKGGRKEKKAEARKAKWTAFRRGETGLCGIKWLNRRTLVFILFGLCIAVGIILAFTIPRVPSFSFSADAPLSQATGDWASAVPTLFSRAPANFSFPAFANLQLNTQDNFLPVHFNHIRAQVFDRDTDREVATGKLDGYSAPAKAFPVVALPLNFTYVATNDTEQTWKSWYESCRNKGNTAGGKRPILKLKLLLNLDIRGLPSKHTAGTPIDADCPIELPLNSA